MSNSTDYLKVYCELILYSDLVDPEMEHYEGGINIGYDLSKGWLIVKAQGVWFETVAKHDNFRSYIKTWQQANTLQIEVTRNNSNDKIKMDGTNTVFPVLVMKGLIDGKKMPGEQQIYKIDQITFEQRSTAS